MSEIKSAIRCREFLEALGIPQEKSDAVMAVMANAIHSKFGCIPACEHHVSKSELFQKIEEAMLKDGDLSCL